MAGILGWAAFVGISLLTSYIFRKVSKREPAGRERFEGPRVEEGAVLPVVFGVAELAPSFRWVGPAKRILVEDDSRTEWYAPMAGPLCHGELTQLVDVKFGDRWLSAAAPSKNSLGPALSTELPFSFAGSVYYAMINAIHWFGGTDTVDGQGGIAGPFCVHPGTLSQAACDRLKAFWGDEYTPGFPKQAYVVFGGAPGPCVIDDLAHYYKWKVRQNLETGPAAPQFDYDAYNQGNHILTSYQAPEYDDSGKTFVRSAGFHFPDFSSGAVCGQPTPGSSHTCYNDNGSISQICMGGSDCTWLAEIAGDPVQPGTIRIKTAWQTCFGCTAAYLHALHTVHCFKPGDTVTIRFRYKRSPLFNLRFPIWSGGLSITVTKPGVMDLSYNVDNFQTLGAIGGEDTQSEDVVGEIPTGLGELHEWTFVVPGNMSGDCELGIILGGGFRTPWATHELSQFTVTVTPQNDPAQDLSYMDERYTRDGLFYWGTNPQPPAPVFIVKRIPMAVSGAGILQGANPIDCIYDVMLDRVFGMGVSAGAFNLSNLQTAATRLKDEGFQVSHVVSSQTSAEDVIGDFLTAIDAILYTNRQTGLIEITLVRPDYSVSLLPTIDHTNILAGSFNYEEPQSGELLNELRLTFRRYRSRATGASTVTQLGAPPYPEGGWFTMITYPIDRNASEMVVTQGTTVIPPSHYIYSSKGWLRFVDWSVIDFDGPDPLIATYLAGGSAPGFEDAVVTAFDEAAGQSMAEIRSESMNIPMIMDDVVAQRVVENYLRGRSRQLKAFDFTLDRTLPTLHPGSMVKLGQFTLRTGEIVDFGGLPARILKMTDTEEGIQVEALEEKWGFRENALIFPPNPERPPLGFPGEDDGELLGAAPRPLGLGQITPSAVRLAIFPADDDFPIELARTRTPSFFSGETDEHGGTECPAHEPEYFLLPAGTTTYDDTSVPNDGCPVYYWIRHVRAGWQPSPWVGPLEAELSFVTPPATEQDALAPSIEEEVFEDWLDTMIGTVLLWILDPQHRLISISYRTRLEGEDWSTAQAPPVGTDWADETTHPGSAGWQFAEIAVPMHPTKTLTVAWEVTYAWEAGPITVSGSVTFPLDREPVWVTSGAIVTASVTGAGCEGLQEVVTASRRGTRNYALAIQHEDGSAVTLESGEEVTL